ncbi:MAG: hypothetical protein ABR536_07025 [Solirubrobacterales bacterium]
MLRTRARFPERIGPGVAHYESFYIKATRPGGGQGVWIRHTVHKRPGQEATCAIWFVLFDAEAEAPRATKAQYGAERLSVPEGSYIKVAEAELGDGRAIGRLATDAFEASWHLRFSDPHQPFHHLPREFLYDAKLPKTKFLSPYPNAIFDGVMTIAGEQLEVHGWRGMIGHNWGAEHAERWVWVQGAAFEGHDAGDYFDMAVGRIRVAGLRSPWVGNANLVLDGTEHRLGGFERLASTKVSEEPTGAHFSLKGKGLKLSGRVSSPAKNFVAWIYADPVGPEHTTLNCSISDLELAVERDGAPSERLVVTGAAAYEFGSREVGHGIPVQPYPDG